MWPVGPIRNSPAGHITGVWNIAATHGAERVLCCCVADVSLEKNIHPEDQIRLFVMF